MLMANQRSTGSLHKAVFSNYGWHISITIAMFVNTKHRYRLWDTKILSLLSTIVFNLCIMYLLLLLLLGVWCLDFYGFISNGNNCQTFPNYMVIKMGWGCSRLVKLIPPCYSNRDKKVPLTLEVSLYGVKLYGVNLAEITR